MVFFIYESNLFMSDVIKFDIFFFNYNLKYRDVLWFLLRVLVFFFLWYLVCFL